MRKGLASLGAVVIGMVVVSLASGTVLAVKPNTTAAKTHMPRLACRGGIRSAGRVEQQHEHAARAPHQSRGQSRTQRGRGGSVVGKAAGVARES